MYLDNNKICHTSKMRLAASTQRRYHMLGHIEISSISLQIMTNSKPGLLIQDQIHIYKKIF
jgi:hypothetical protein